MPGSGLLLHDFRRSAVRNMIRCGVPQKIEREISGYKTDAVFSRYNIVSEEDLRQAARRHVEHVQSQEQTAKVVTAKRAQVTVKLQYETRQT